MSTPIVPVSPDSRSMSQIRGLLERNLVDRAVAFAELRWPGSGPLVRLAHDWGKLPPAGRREALATIGPEELARLRGVAELQPELARVLDDLEQRGIIPPAAAVVVEEAPAQPQTFDERLVEAALDYAEQGVQQVIERASPEVAPAAAAGAAAGAAAASAYVRRSPHASVSMPILDLGMPSTAEFLEDETQRRAESMQRASDTLERVRERLERSAERLTASQPEPAPASVDPLIIEQAPEPRSATPAPAPPPAAALKSPPAAPTASRWAEAVAASVVLDVGPAGVAPTAADLAGAARTLNLGYVDLDRARLDARAFFGGLVRHGRETRAEAGLLPRAASEPNLVVVRGRLYPSTIERLRAGFCDIPGTRATVRVDPRARIVVLPE